MSDRGDDGHQPHPGDPWHPGGSESDEGAAPEAPEGETADEPTARRGLFRRRRHDEGAPEVAAADGEDEAAGPLPADGAAAGGSDPDIAEVPGTAPTDGPQPAWLPEAEPDPDDTLTVDLPSWASDATTGAEGVDGGFIEPVIDDDDDDLVGDGEAPTPRFADVEAAELGAFEAEPEAMAPGGSGADHDLAAALEALGALAEDDVEPSTGASDGGEPEAIDLAARESDSPGPEEAAAISEYGVAGPEAFDALRELDDPEDDLADWEEYASAPAPDIPADEVSEEPEARRRGVWPFHRRDDAAEDVVDEEAVDASGEWGDDGSAIPRQWFADIDEDTVEAPPADLPESEWPESRLGEPITEPSLFEEPGALAEEPPPVDGAAPAEPEVTGVPSGAWGGEEAESDVEGIALPGHSPDAKAGPGAGPGGADRHAEVAAPSEGWDDAAGSDVPEDGWADEGPASVPMAWGSESDETPPVDEWTAAVGDDLFPDRLELGFDDGTGESVPIRREAFDDGDEDDADEWVTGPLDVASDDPTEVLPPDYGELEHLSDAIYRTAATQEHRGLAEEIFRAGDEEREWQAISAAMPGVETGVVGFDDVADLGSGDEYDDTRVRSDIGTRVLTGVVLAGFFLGSLWVAPEALAGFIAIIVLLGLGELYATLRRRGLRPLPVFGFLGGIALLATAWFHGPVAIPAALAITTVVTFFVYAFSPLRGDALTNGGLTVLGLGWVVGTAAFAYPILESEDYRVLVLAIVVLTAAMDIGAYAVGRAWGARALAPVLSPNKSVEGLMGGIAVCMLAAGAVGSLLEPFDLMSGIGLGIVVVFAAPLGDLAESMLKRSLGVKDMGSILPGHGGILDRIDALLFVIPAAWVFYQFAGLLG